jgi:hypothetical protein
METIMSELELVKWGFILILGGFTFMIQRELKAKDQSIQQLQTEVQNIKTNYLHRDDFKEFKVELRSMFDEIRKDIRSLNTHEKN